MRRGFRGQCAGLTFWTPNINIYRDPRWGRGQETYGEDPYLTARMGVAFVQGLQGNDPRHLKAAACAKHYAVHSGPEAGRHTFDSIVTQRDLRETYLPAFQACVMEAGVESVMTAYNRTNGEACSASPTLLGRILRGEWKFDGHVVSDCGAIDPSWAHEHCAAILFAWYPGQAGGTALADVLFGEFNPAGRLPVSFPRSVKDLPHFHSYAMAGRTYRYAEKAPLYPFGHGLSYTTFCYANISLSQDSVAPNGRVTVGVEVYNSGPVSGDEVVQLYIEPVASSVLAPRLHLEGFKRIHLAAGRVAKVVFELRADQFCHYQDDGTPFYDPGEYRIHVGGGQPKYGAGCQVSIFIKTAGMQASH